MSKEENLKHICLINTKRGDDGTECYNAYEEKRVF